ALARAKWCPPEVVRDPEEPGRERHRPPPEPVDRLERPDERLVRQILGVVPVRNRELEVAEDPVEVDEVELLERRSLAALRPLDQPPDIRPGRARRRLLSAHRNCRFAHPAPLPGIPRRGIRAL